MTPDTLTSVATQTTVRTEKKSRLGFYIFAGLVVVSSIAGVGAIMTWKVHQGIFEWQAYAALLLVFGFIFFVDWLLLRGRQD